MKVGFFSIGLETYWGQYEGLMERLTGYHADIAKQLTRMGVEVVDAGMIDNIQKSHAASEQFQSQSVQLVCLHVSTYALSSTVLPVVQHVQCPVLILNLQPAAAINYDYLNSLPDRVKMTGEWLAHCQTCVVPELACVFSRAGIKYDILTGHLQDSAVWAELRNWIDAAFAVEGMKHNRMGILGHYYCGMLDVYTDTTLQSATFGTHIELLEMCELKALHDAVTSDELTQKLKEFETTFNVDPKCAPYELERAARTSVALDRLIETHQLGSLAYYYEGQPGNAYEDIVTSMIAGNTLLTGKGIPTAGECEVKNVQAMKIMSLLGAGGSFAEPYAMDLEDDVMLWGHDGPGHFNMAEDGISLVPLPVFHGKPGQGLSIQMSVHHGPVTLLSVCEGKGEIHLLVAEGESVPGKTLHIGNTNSRYRFPISVKDFVSRWSKGAPSHHCAIGVGHVADKIEKFAFLLGINIINVTK